MVTLVLIYLSRGVSIIILYFYYLEWETFQEPLLAHTLILRRRPSLLMSSQGIQLICINGLGVCKYQCGHKGISVERRARLMHNTIEINLCVAFSKRQQHIPTSAASSPTSITRFCFFENIFTSSLYNATGYYSPIFVLVAPRRFVGGCRQLTCLLPTNLEMAQWPTEKVEITSCILIPGILSFN